jgi:hypothetical protein
MVIREKCMYYFYVAIGFFIRFVCTRYSYECLTNIFFENLKQEFINHIL